MGTKIFSLGSLISLIGLVVMAGGTWCGLALGGFSPAIAGLIGLAVLLVGGTAVFLGARAKECNSDFAKWLRIEISCIVAMFLVFMFAVMPTATTFNFIREHGSLASAAGRDISGIDSLMADFERNETERMDGTFRGLESYLRLGNNNCSPQLRQYIQNELGSSPRYFSNNVINNSRGAVEVKIVELRLDNRRYRTTFDDALEKMRSTAESRWPLTYAGLNDNLEVVAAEVGNVLTQISAGLNLPRVYAGQGSQYTISVTEPTVYSFEPSAYREAYDAVGKYSWITVVMAVAFAFMAMFYYIITYRALRKAVDKKAKISDSLGLPI